MAKIGSIGAKACSLNMEATCGVNKISNRAEIRLRGRMKNKASRITPLILFWFSLPR